MAQFGDLNDILATPREQTHRSPHVVRTRMRQKGPMEQAIRKPPTRTGQRPDRVSRWIAGIDPALPVLIAGPTASGKSALALALAESQGGVIVNADAIQVFEDWRILTARPSLSEEARARHQLYGHVPGSQPYSVGAWLKDVEPLLTGPERPIIIGGTGLYFTALTEGLAQIPQIDAIWRERGNALLRDAGLGQMVAELDTETRNAIDLQNPSRVQRAWEVLNSTGRGMRAWQQETPPPRLPLATVQPVVIDAPKDWLTPRIEKRFDQMLEAGALGEAEENKVGWSTDRPSAKAIGARELMAYLEGDITLDAAREQACILTRQFAKRQRTWFRARMRNWEQIPAADLAS